jgi:hypothetical protein
LPRYGPAILRSLHVKAAGATDLRSLSKRGLMRICASLDWGEEIASAVRQVFA